MTTAFGASSAIIPAIRCPRTALAYSRWMLRRQSKTCVAEHVLLGLIVAVAASPPSRGCAGRDDRPGAVPHDRRRRDDAPPAGRFLHAADLAGEQLPAGVTSRAGAQGAAQFMPGTAAERGLADPFDPEQAIPKSAELLDRSARRASAISGLRPRPTMAGRRGWKPGLRDAASLPGETRNYVSAITGRSAEDWADVARSAEARPTQTADALPGLVAGFRRGERRPAELYRGAIAGRSRNRRSRRGACRSRAISPRSSRSRAMRAR